MSKHFGLSLLFVVLLLNSPITQAESDACWQCVSDRDQCFKRCDKAYKEGTDDLKTCYNTCWAVQNDCVKKNNCSS